MRKRPVLIALCALLGVVLGSCASAPIRNAAPAPETTPPKNPFLADSAYAIGHTNSAQIDSTMVPGPAVPSHRLTAEEIEVNATGPGHLGQIIAGPYPDGKRVIWTNSAHDVVKMDYATLKVLATFRLDQAPAFSAADVASIEARLKAGTLEDRLKYGGQAIRAMMPNDLANAYTLIDREGNYYVGRKRGITVYGDERPGDRLSPIAIKHDFTLPDEIPGNVVGMNMTYDGWVVLATDAGIIVVLTRDFDRHHFVRLPHSDEAADYNARMAAEHRGGYNWIRNSIATDDRGGIYVAANNWMQKVVWTGRDLSVDPRQGAWAERYANNSGYGTGSTPVLVGFGPRDRFVVITDGDKLMAVTLFWRDDIPRGWKAPAGALSNRIAGAVPVTLDDPKRTALQSEQAVVVAGYNMLVVNNEPASLPPNFPPQGKGLLISLFADEPAFTPHGMEKIIWDPVSMQLRKAWVNKEISSPNCVPYVSLGSNRAYTVGVRDGEWTLESVHLESGIAAEHYKIGGARYNTMFSGIYVDDQGRVIYGGMFGSVRLNPAGSAKP